MASRLTKRHRATVLVTERTLNQAMYEARQLVKQVGHGDPRSKQLMDAYNEIANALRSGDPARAGDDANGETAQRLKGAVDTVARLRGEIARGQAAPAQAPEKAPITRTQEMGVPAPKRRPAVASAKKADTHKECPECEASGFENQQELDNHVDDKHRGRLASAAKPKDVPMSRLFTARKKNVEADEEEAMLDTAPEAVAGEAPAEPLPEAGLPAEQAPVGPAAEPLPEAGPAPSAGNSFANLPTEALTAIAEALTKVDNWQVNPAILGAIEQVAEELKNRPMQPAPVEGAPKAASAKVAVTPPGISEELAHKIKRQYPGEPEKAYGTMWKIHNEKEGASEPPEGWDGAAASMQASGLDAPQANVLAHWMKGQGYTPHKAGFLVRRRGGPYWLAKYAAAKTAENPGVPPVNEDTLNKVDGQPHEVPEVGEAHGDRENVEQAEKHNENPGKGVTEIKSPQDMEKQAGADSEVTKALKLAEQLEKKLGDMYLDAKPIMRANASAACRDAVESIYDARNKFAEAKKVLNKHEMQANAEKEAQDSVLKKRAAAPEYGLILAAAEN